MSNSDVMLDWEPSREASLLEIDEQNHSFDNDAESQQEEKNASAEDIRPIISHLPDAIVVQDGERILLADIGDDVIFESTTGDRWNFTKQIIIKSIDDASGNVNGWDRTRSQYSGFNYLTNDQYGVVVKLLTKPLKKRRRKRRTKAAA